MKQELIGIWRSPYSDFGKALKVANDLQDETFTAVNAYTDEVLSGIAGSGFNAIWVHGLLQNLVPSGVFPEFGKHSRKHIKNMRSLIVRAARHGLKVFVYMQPPRGINVKHAFWKNNMDVGGTVSHCVSDDGYKVEMRALCTSTQKVKDYLRTSPERLIREIPDLGGVILITASEYSSHCYGHFHCSEFYPKHRTGKPFPIECPRCRQRHPVDVVSEIIQLFRDGVRAVSKNVQIIAWNWGWTLYEKDPCAAIISSLPKDVVLMSGFERGGTKVILGKRRLIDEYSLSFAGPSGRFLRSFCTARKHGLKVMAKLQIGTTHELATVPNLPLIGRLHKKAMEMRKLGIDGFLGCWNFGNMLTANTAAFNSFFNAERPKSKKKALSEFASTYFPGCDASAVVQAWEQFETAMNSYPFSVPFLYRSPINYSLAYSLKPGQAAGTPMGRSWQMDKRGEDLRHSFLYGCYTLSEVIKGVEFLSKKWKIGATLLERVLKNSECEEARQEIDNAWVCYHIFRSTWNTYRVYRLRRRWTDSKLPAYLRIIRNELTNLKAAFPIVEADPRFGYHSEAQAYMFNAASIRKKIILLKRQIHEIQWRLAKKI